MKVVFASFFKEKLKCFSQKERVGLTGLSNNEPCLALQRTNYSHYACDEENESRLCFSFKKMVHGSNAPRQMNHAGLSNTEPWPYQGPTTHVFHVTKKVKVVFAFRFQGKAQMLLDRRIA